MLLAYLLSLVPWWAYMVGLAVATVISGLTSLMVQDYRLLRACGAILANFMAGIIFELSTGILDHWGFNILIDSITALIIIARPAGRAQSLLVVSYCVQIAMHGAYGVLWIKGIAEATPYYNWLTGVAWIQLFILGGWCAGHWWRAYYHRSYSVDNSRVDGSLASRVGGPR